MKKDIFISNYIKEFEQIINLVENKNDKIIAICNLLKKKKISKYNSYIWKWRECNNCLTF